MSPTVVAVIISSLVSGCVSLGVVALSDTFGRKRDREAEWRKVKLAQYREFTAALSGIVHHGTDEASQRRYADAVNNMTLIAPPQVLEALYAFQDETSFKNTQRNPVRYENLFSDLARKMRLDCHPIKPRDSEHFLFRTVDIPPTVEGVERAMPSRYTHSPLRISGSALPSAAMPSTSIAPDPIIQST